MLNPLIAERIETAVDSSVTVNFDELGIHGEVATTVVKMWRDKGFTAGLMGAKQTGAAFEMKVSWTGLS
jgi:hypothetical protein